MIALLLLLASPGLAAFSAGDVATRAAPFLKLAPGARSAALGEAFLAAPGGAESLFWNPSALAGEGSASAFFTYAPLFAGMSYQAGAYARPLPGGQAWAVGLQHFSSGELQGLDEFGLDTGGFSTTDVALTAAYARPVGRAAAGAALKWVKTKVQDSASALSADLGLLLRPAPAWTLGFSARNLFGSLKTDAEAFGLPLTLGVGAGWAPAERWRLEADLHLPADNRPFLALGAERAVPLARGWRGFARAGANSRSLSDVEGLRNLALGLGAELSSAETGELLTLDYAFFPMGRLGASHRLTVGIRFGGRGAPAPSEPPAAAAAPQAGAPPPGPLEVPIHPGAVPPGIPPAAEEAAEEPAPAEPGEPAPDEPPPAAEPAPEPPAPAAEPPEAAPAEAPALLPLPF